MRFMRVPSGGYQKDEKPGGIHLNIIKRIHLYKNNINSYIIKCIHIFIFKFLYKN